MAAAEDFIDKTILIAESARLFPGILGRGLASLLEIHFSAQHKVFNTLVPVAQQRIDEQELRRSGQTDVPEHVSLQDLPDFPRSLNYDANIISTTRETVCNGLWSSHPG